MKSFLVDTNIIIWYLRGREDEIKLLQKLSEEGYLLISVVTITEVRAGLTKNQARVISILKDIFRTIEVNDDIAELAGVFKQKYRLDIADMLIAATAIVTNSKLVTYNKKHFPMPQIYIDNSYTKM